MTHKLETILHKLFVQTFPYQLPKWFCEIIVAWAWLIVPAIVIIQPWIGWGYWDAAHAATGVPNLLFYIAFVIMGLEIALQLLSLPSLIKRRRLGWELLYYSVYCNLAYGVVRIFSSIPSVGPLFGMIVTSILFLYTLFQIRPWYKPVPTN